MSLQETAYEESYTKVVEAASPAKLLLPPWWKKGLFEIEMPYDHSGTPTKTCDVESIADGGTWVTLLNFSEAIAGDSNMHVKLIQDTDLVIAGDRALRFTHNGDHGLLIRFRPERPQ